MKKSMFIGILLCCLFGAGVLYYQLWMPITTMGKYACLASESRYDFEYYDYVRKKVHTDFELAINGGKYDAGKECISVQKYADSLVHSHFDKVFDGYNHRQVKDYLGERTGGKTKEEIYACYANKAVMEYSRLMDKAFELNTQRIEIEALIKASK